ncbi:MAG: hypothetical protein WCJ80_09300 [Bacteroidota bacterium]|jgi:hypothetical protein
MSATTFNSKRFLLSGLVGGIVSFFVGFLIYGILLANMMSSNSGTAANVMRGQNDMIFWSIMLGSLFMGLTLAYIFELAKIKSIGSGFIVGAIAGLLIIAGHDFTSFGTTNLLNLNGLLTDVAASTIMQAITGAAIGFMNSKLKD